MKSYVFAYLQVFNENQRLKQENFDLNIKLKTTEANHKLLVENELLYINKILLLENKLISLKRKMQKKRSKTDIEEPVYYLSEHITSTPVEYSSDVSTLSVSEID